MALGSNKKKESHVNKKQHEEHHISKARTNKTQTKNIVATYSMDTHTHDECEVECGQTMEHQMPPLALRKYGNEARATGAERARAHVQTRLLRVGQRQPGVIESM
jgi:hypothetical protein